MEKNIEELKAVLKKAEEGSVNDIRKTVSYYDFGDFGYPDSEKALYWLRKLYYADQNEYDNYRQRTYKIRFQSVKFLDDGKYTLEYLSEQEQMRYIDLFKDGADNGDSFYCIMMGEILSRPSYVDLFFGSETVTKMYNMQDAIEYYKKAANLGSGVACHKLGDLLSGYEINELDSEAREMDLINLIEIKAGTLKVTTPSGKDKSEELFGNALKDNDRYNSVDFELAKKYYELGAELGNDICKNRLKDYDKRVKKTQRLIARSIPEDPKTGELMENEDIEVLFDWFRDRFEVG